MEPAPVTKTIEVSLTVGLVPIAALVATVKAPMMPSGARTHHAATALDALVVETADNAAIECPANSATTDKSAKLDPSASCDATGGPAR